MDTWVDACPLCRDRDTHLFFKDKMAGRFEREYKRARDEYYQLKNMFKEVCWYNFETQCREWRDPWPESQEDSPLTLHGYRVTSLNGRVHGCYPVYYSGSMRAAPPLPPVIVLKEMRDAFEYMQQADAQQTAPYDWAPDGHLFQELLRTTVWNNFSDTAVNAADSSSETECEGKPPLEEGEIRG